MTRYVLYSEDSGVFLGLFGGFIFCSKGYAGHQNEVGTFPDEETTLKFAERMNRTHNFMNYRAVPVECANEYVATIEECVAAGLPAWSPE